LLRKLSAIAAAFVLAGSIAAPAARAVDVHTATDADITSAAADAITITATVFQPAGSSADAQVPLLLHSHGWGGSRSTGVGSFQRYLDAGFGVLSFDQRGHGESGGEANVEDPDLEGQDVKAVIDFVAGLDWVEHNLVTNENGDLVPDPDDPILGAIGGSYGGGYQTIGALTEVRDTGKTRFDALAPEITWFDLPESLAPQGVVRTAWTTLLYVGAKAGTSIPLWIDQALVYGAATGQWPDGTVPATGADGNLDKATNIDAVFHEHSPVAFVEDGIQLDIPALIGQGATDTLFNLNQGIHNFEQTLTDSARSKSVFVGYNSGHEVGAFVPGAAIGETLPQANNGSANACFGDFTQTKIDFFTAAFAGLNPRQALGVPAYNLTTDADECLALDALPTRAQSTEFPIVPVSDVVPGWGTQSGAGAPVHYELADGPITVAGIPRLEGDLFATPDARAFFALSIGSDVTDARVIQSNVMPLRAFPAGLGDGISIELPGIAVEVPAGQKLFLTVSPVSDIFFGHAKTPGFIALGDMAVRVPVVANQ